MIDPFTKTRFHPDLKLETWYPEGILDHAMATSMVSLVSFEERVADEPFNRFADLSKLTAVHLNFTELAEIAEKRREASKGELPAKTAFLATNAAAYGVARMFAALMEPSPIEVQVFCKAAEAAEWLGVPLEALRAE